MEFNKYHNLSLEEIQLTIGPYKLYTVEANHFGLDGGAMFGTVPKVLWERTNPADKDNQIPLSARCLLLVSDTEKILIDTGLGGSFEEKYGPKLGPKFSEFYKVPNERETQLIKNLNKLHISHTDITSVILTHLHFDHAGGATQWDSQLKKLVPTFPNSTYYIQKDNLQTAKTPNLREKASYYSSNFLPLIEANCLKVLTGNQKLNDFISLEISNGHTLGQQTVWIQDDTTTLCYAADLIPTCTHTRLPWVMGYDLDPLTLIEEKKQSLTKLNNSKSYIFFEHDPYCHLAQIKEHKSDFRAHRIFKLINSSLN